MILNECKKLNRGHLKRNRNILIRIDHNNIIKLVRRNLLKKSTTIIGCDLDVFGEFEILIRKICDLLIDLDTFNIHFIKIPVTLCCKGPASHSENKYIQRFFLFVKACHIGSRHVIVIAHAGKLTAFFIDGLNSEKYVC